MEEIKVSNKRSRVDSVLPESTTESRTESDTDSPAVKRLRENLLDEFDDETELRPESQDLDSFMKSFEEEIKASPTHKPSVVDLTSDSGESQPELGYLLEASDDELGLPPTESVTRPESERVESDLTSQLGGEFWEAPSFEPFGFGFEETDGFNGVNNGFVETDGFFDDSDLGFGPSDFSWRFETLPAQ